MSTVKRLIKAANPYKGDFITGTIFVIISAFLETAVLSAIIATLISLITDSKFSLDKPLEIPLIPESWKSSLSSYLQNLPGLQKLGEDGGTPFQLFMILSVVALVIALIKCALNARGSYLNNRFSNRLSRSLRDSLFEKMAYMPPSFYEKESSGSLLSRITGDVGMLQSLVGPQLSNVLQSPVTILLSLIIMLFIDWRVTCAVLVLAPIISVVSTVIGRKIKKITGGMQKRLAELNSNIVEKLSNIKVIQSFVREKYEINRVELLNYNYYKDNMRSVMLAEILSPTVEYLSWFGMILGAIIGGYSVLNGYLSSNAFLLFMLLAQRAGSQFKQLSRLNQLKQQITATGDRIFDILDIENEITNTPQATCLDSVTGCIEFKNVDFRYQSSEVQILKNISLTVRDGEIIALVGPSGSGKTTLVNLLPRFYDPVGGAIYIDGKNIRNVSLESLRMNIGIVPQETLLFSGTIYDNIAYGNLSANREQIEDAAAVANALGFINRMPEGFDTLIGERGARLSGGQRQRIAIARAVLKNPKILILDEATSALDTESEYLVQQALERLMENRTTFVIAHRLSTIKNANRIAVLNRGEIVEIGAHSELITKNGIYANLYNMQFSGTEV